MCILIRKKQSFEVLPQKQLLQKQSASFRKFKRKGLSLEPFFLFLKKKSLCPIASQSVTLGHKQNQTLSLSVLSLFIVKLEDKS
jgi:hypothetical protein